MVVLVSSSLVEVEEVVTNLTDLMVLMVVHTLFLPQHLILQIQMHRLLVLVEEDTHILQEMHQVLLKTLDLVVEVDKEIQDLPLVVVVALVSFLLHILLNNCYSLLWKP